MTAMPSKQQPTLSNAQARVRSALRGLRGLKGADAARRELVAAATVLESLSAAATSDRAKYLTIVQAGRELGVAAARLYRWTTRGALPAPTHVVPGHRRPMYARDEVAALAARVEELRLADEEVDHQAPPGLVSRQDLAERLGCGPVTICHHVKTGLIPAPRRRPPRGFRWGWYWTSTEADAAAETLESYWIAKGGRAPAPGSRLAKNRAA